MAHRFKQADFGMQHACMIACRSFMSGVVTALLDALRCSGLRVCGVFVFRSENLTFPYIDIAALVH